MAYFISSLNPVYIEQSVAWSTGDCLGSVHLFFVFLYNDKSANNITFSTKFVRLFNAKFWVRTLGSVNNRRRRRADEWL